MIVYDFEVHKHWWCVTFAHLKDGQVTFISSDNNTLLDFFNEHCKELFVGFNNVHYDQWIMKALLMGMKPYPLSQHLISGESAWTYSQALYKIPMFNYDTGDKFKSLKQLEGFMGESIEECSVPFDLDRPLTDEEKEEVRKYNLHDVEQTIKVLQYRWADFIAHKDIIKTFKLPYGNFSKTKAQLTAEALGCNAKYFTDNTEFSILQCIDINKYKEVVEWFRSKECLCGKKLKTYVAGLPHTFGLGGVHAGGKCVCDKNLLHIDVNSFYPSIMIEHDLLSRAVQDKDIYKNIYETRLALKKAGKKIEQAPYKIVLNSTFGICNDKFSKAYDPRRALEVCINGQLLLLDLIEKIEPYCSIVQSNTDGLIISYKDNCYMDIVSVCAEWQQRTKMGLGFDELKIIYQGDVNNYVTDYECKGSWVKELSSIDYDLPIVNKAIKNYLLNNIPVEETINNCNDLIEFQKIVKVGKMYDYCVHNGNKYNLRVYRVFASTNKYDGTLLKKKHFKQNLDKVGNTPEHLFIDNSKVKDKKVPSKLDKGWYIKLAKERLNKFI